MPLVRSIQILSDRIEIETPRGTRTFLFSDIGQAVRNQGAAAIESFVNTRLDDPDRGFAQSAEGRHFYMEIKVITLDPLLINVIISNVPITDSQRSEAIRQD